MVSRSTGKFNSFSLLFLSVFFPLLSFSPDSALAEDSVKELVKESVVKESSSAPTLTPTATPASTTSVPSLTPTAPKDLSPPQDSNSARVERTFNVESEENLDAASLLGLEEGSILGSACFVGNGLFCIRRGVGGCVGSSPEDFCSACEMIRSRTAAGELPGCQKKEGYSQLQRVFASGWSCQGLNERDCHCDAGDKDGGPRCLSIDNYRSPKWVFDDDEGAPPKKDKAGKVVKAKDKDKEKGARAPRSEGATPKDTPHPDPAPAPASYEEQAEGEGGKTSNHHIPTHPRPKTASEEPAKEAEAADEQPKAEPEERQAQLEAPREEQVTPPPQETPGD